MRERRIIRGELCERVESFGELTPGIVVWALRCGWCGEDRRQMIVRQGESVLRSSTRGPLRGSYCDAVPMHACIDGSETSITDETVAQGRVFRVVDEQMDAENDTVARVRKLVRV